MTERYNKEKKLYDTLRNDISEGGLSSDLSRDYKELKEFFLNEDRKKQLGDMGKIKRFFYMLWWLLKELLLKLNPTRRLVLLLGIVLLATGTKIGLSDNSFTFGTDTSLLGGIMILFILMLELKDKLLAKDELSAGRTVQTALMSEENPIVEGWKIWLFTQPANDVGGDLVDLIKKDDGKYGITIADVSGKGLGAALLMAKLQTMLRAFAPDYSSLELFVRKVNQAFHKDIMPNSFASMVYIELKENNDEVEIINAGHLPPILVKDGNVTQMPKGNAALGLVGNSEYKSEKISLNNDEYFIAYSDGVIEARDENGIFFGIDRLLNFIEKVSYNSPEQLGNKLLKQIKYFIGDAKSHDDLSIAILKREKNL